jgi:uncharacterized SAM-dependent methyltransferase
MTILKSKDVAQKYNISITTVLSWIENATEKKNNLIVEKVGKKFKIIDSQHNHAELLKLSEQALVYRNKVYVKTVEPHSDLYKDFSRSQLIELVNSLKVKKQVPLKFTYLNKGAKNWDNFILDSATNNYHDIQTRNLIKKASLLLNERFKGSKKFNIIDIGTGNSINMEELTKSLLEKNLLNKYIGIDISSNILEISKSKVTRLSNKIRYKSYVIDVERSDFSEVLFENKEKNVINLVFFIGGTIGNMENLDYTLTNFYYSLDDEDLLITDDMFDNYEVRSSFQDHRKNRHHIWLLDFLGIDVDECQIINQYNEEKERRESYLQLDKDYMIEFNNPRINTVVSLFKGERILFWHHGMSKRDSLFKSFSRSNLELADFTTNIKGSHFLAILKAKK